MAEQNVGEILKEFAAKITTSKVNERRRILGNVVSCVVKPDFPEPAIKGVFRVLVTSLSLYRDRASRRAVEAVVQSLATTHTTKALKVFNVVLNDVAEAQKKVVPCVHDSGLALCAFSWSCIMFRHVFPSIEALSGPEFSKLVSIQGLLLYGCLAVQRATITQAAYNRCKRIWSQIPGSIDRYAEVVVEGEPSAYQMVIISLIAKYLSQKKQQDVLQKFRPTFVSHFARGVLASRMAPPRHLLITCNDLLRHATHEDFTEVILPALEKAMLRNPEIMLEGVVYLLAGLNIDLSAYALTVGKHLGTQLHSKEEAAREVAALGCKHIAKQCSDPDAVETLVKHLFAILNGSEGKLSGVGERRGLLSGIGETSNNAVSGAASQNSLSQAVSEAFIPVLQQEVNEGTLVHALSMLSLWCTKFHGVEVPGKLVEWFKSGMALKSATAVVRTAYIQCMTVAFAGDRLCGAACLLPMLVSTVDKASSQAGNAALVTEAVAAAVLIVKLAAVDIQCESKLSGFWAGIVDSDKALMTNDKYLSVCGEDALISLATLTEKLILDHPQRLEQRQVASYYHAFVVCITRGSYKQRRHAHTAGRKMLAGLGGGAVAVSLLQQFGSVLKSIAARYDPDAEVIDSPPRVLCEALLTLSRIPVSDVAEARRVAKETLTLAHHPLIAEHNADAWTDIMAQLKLDASQFVADNAELIMDDVRTAAEISASMANMLATCARISPNILLPQITAHIAKSFSDPGMSNVTVRDYEIMLTPEGELYDKSILEGSNKQQAVIDKNVRRENKLYSYAEQMADLELKKEIDRKKGKSVKKEEPKLTKKQQEMLAAQMADECEIRAKLSKLNVELVKCCALLASCCRGNGCGLRRQMPVFLQRMMKLLKSPLAAPHLSQAYTALRTAALTDQARSFSLLLAHATLRLASPACALDVGWSAEPLQAQAKRAVCRLAELTVPEPHGRNIPLPAPAFAYCFYLLRGVMRKEAGGVLTWGEDIYLSAIDTVSAHANVRAEVGMEDSGSEHGPELLPRCEMLQLMVDVVGSCGGVVQQRAARAIVDIAMAASGLEGCAAAEQEEIDVLLSALTSPAMVVREAALQGLMVLAMVLPAGDDTHAGLWLLQRVWVARFDPETENRRLADSLWEEAGLCLDARLCSALASDVIHHESVVRSSAAEALATIVQQHPDYVTAILHQLLEIYNDKLYMAPVQMDEMGRLLSDGGPDEWEARCGIAMAMASLSNYITQDLISVTFEFFVQKGLRDRHVEVRKSMLTAAVAAVDQHGKANVSRLLSVFEEFMSAAPDTASYDTVRQSVVILMGSLAKHLDKDDPKVKPIVAKLIETLSTPSQQVQEAVANCLPPLVPAIKADAPDLVRRLLQLLLESENYGERKGAAYGLAGLIKGLGILALKQLDIMTRLTAAIQDKKMPRYREGALFAFEMLCIMLGRLFEPYVVHILPHLLLCFGDANQYVREAADDTAKAVMSKLSAHGVKLVLPSLLTALEEDSWRTKTGSVELLGAMAFCAPKQLSACLPSIVPKLMEVLTDSHLKVQNAGAQALKQIGSVIKNPEIQAIVPNLLEALQDPNRKTTTSLKSLLQTKFVHFIDAPSLALIMPVVQRAFQDRSTETRKMAAQIIGNMYSLTDQKDLSPYLPAVIPGLKASLLDPVPEVRSVSARALGAMVKGMGESGFEDLLPWLMRTLTSEQSSVDRSGAAQGLSEVVGGLGMEKLDRLMPDIIGTAERADIQSHVRDGYIMMYIYLPGVFGDGFMKYVGPIIPSILKALADENEYVRDTALRAGQRIVNMYAEDAILLLLPELEQGLFDDNWRIRYSSVQLLGDLLYKISGVSGKMTTETAGEDDNFGTERSQTAILESFGEERRNRVLAGLYMGRSDTALMVRQASLHVWKIIVSHTPKTLREILPTLFSLLLGCLASPSYDKRQVAARTLGDVVRKLGEKVLPEIIPILEEGLESPRSDQRQGVCIGLSEIMGSTSRDHVIVFADSLIPTVRKALTDPLAEVREAAAKTFDNLHGNIGTRALDDILPSLLSQLDDPETSEFALDGLQQVMTVKSRVVLPYLVPQLTSVPVNTRALSFISSVAGEALTRHLGRILPALMSSLQEKMDTESEAQELAYCTTVVLSVQDDIGIRTIMDELLSTMAQHSQTDGLRWAAVTLLHVYCEQTKVDYGEYVAQLFRGLLAIFTYTHERVLHATWDCLNAVIKQLDASDMLAHISNLRQAVRLATSDFKEEELPGFCLPKKGISPIWLIYREGILNGPQELKEAASMGLGEVIRRTSPAALKPSVVSITGPLIRILGDRFSFSVKVAVLETLGLLLAKCGAMLKPFLPQLQTTFLKAMNDANRSVRLKAAAALSKLITIHIRVDTLFTELHTGIRNAEDQGIRDTMLQALRGCISGAGNKMSEPTRRTLSSTLEGFMSATEDTTRTTAAAALGTLAACLTNDELTQLLIKHLLDTDTSEDWVVRHGRAVALSIALKEAPQRLLTDEHMLKVVKAVHSIISADRIPLTLAGLRCAGFILSYQICAGDTVVADLLSDIVRCMKADSNDVKQLAALIISFLAKSVNRPLDIHIIKSVVPMLVNGTKEKNTLVRTNSECALVAVLRLRLGDTILQSCLSVLETGMREALNEVTGKVLRKAATQPDSTDDIDDTILL